jgi:hypothetical protein
VPPIKDVLTQIANVYITPQQIELLAQAERQYAGRIYDEVVDEVIERVAETGSIGKCDIGALVLWKRLRANSPWVTKLLNRSDNEVRKVTAQAVMNARDSDQSIPNAADSARHALDRLPGFTSGGNALASALLYAAAPDRMAIYDRRARQGLIELLGIDVRNQSGSYLQYMALVERIVDAASAAGLNWRPRQVDIALYEFGNPKSRDAVSQS